MNHTRMALAVLAAAALATSGCGGSSKQSAGGSILRAGAYCFDDYADRRQNRTDLRHRQPCQTTHARRYDPTGGSHMSTCQPDA